jgi:Na+/H+ antiporter NhaD/arsenite permease-like protein
MATYLLLLIFLAGYLAIVLEHPLGINKTASALLTGIFCWVILALNSSPGNEVLASLSHHLSGISEILFFLLGAMTIVEVIDSHYGFKKITAFIRSESPVRLLWIMSWTAFFFSALLDNLTTAIVMASITRKMVEDKTWRLYIVSMVVIAANAGGAWSPIGDVTTTMLWVGGHIETMPLIKTLFIPSVISLLVPLILISLLLRKNKLLISSGPDNQTEMPQGSSVVLFFGLGGLFMVPVFKNFTHLPPYLGILLVLGMVWVLTEIIHQAKQNEDKSVFTPSHALSKIDTPSILFFLGILLAVSALETAGILRASSQWLDGITTNKSIIMAVIGLASAVVDNVPLVAAAIGMYDLSDFPAGHPMWNELAFAAGTGGSILIIGSAAGVAVMGIEKIEFLWYLKRISLLALAGFFAGYFCLLALIQP